MNDKVRELLAQITALEDQIEDSLRSSQDEVIHRLNDGKIRFRKDIEDAQKQFRQSVLRWMLDSRPRITLTVPFIYGMVIPLAFLDLCISIYQAVCFPLYRINKVKRRNYILIDRHHLHYLNFFERMHCMYCSYANGLLAYAREIAARTEQFWCPIKHASRVVDRHSRYHAFADYGDAEGYQKKLVELQPNGDKPVIE